MIPSVMGVVICLNGRERKIYSLILMLFLIVSTVCFDNFKTGDLVRLSDTENKSTRISTADYSSFNKDVCTVEMLGTSQTILFSQQTAYRNSELVRRSESLFLSTIDNAAIKLPFKSFAVVNPLNLAENRDTTETIHFIHNKDGKKKI
jgi:hypothetical protein